MPARPEKRRPKRAPRSRFLFRWLVLGGLLLVVFLYYRPLRTYFQARQALAQRTAELKSLRREQRALEQRVARVASGGGLVREARKLGLVKAGERLFIVNGIEAWRKARATIGGGG
jgi:cell division protein FtsB